MREPNSIADKPSDDSFERRDTLFNEKDHALRRDVHALGNMIGELLVDQGSEQLYNAVENARRLAIQAREAANRDTSKLASMVDSLSPDMARDLIRGFSTYFQLVNSAEQVHRIRRRRDYLKDNSTRQPGAFDDTIFRLRDAGLSLEDCLQLLNRLEIMPVFTPHPTETTRRTLLRKQQNIIRRMVEMQNPALTPQEVDAAFESVRGDVTAIWQTEENASEAATVADELEHMLFFLTDVIYPVIPSIYESIEKALRDAYGTAAADVRLTTFFRFGSWVGGDIANNHSITARTVRETLARQRSLILDLYHKECTALAEKLSQSENRVGVEAEIKVRIESYSSQFPRARGNLPHRYRDMPYRLFLRLIIERLQSTYDDDIFPYESAGQLINDLQLIATSLRNHQGKNAGLFAVERLIRRVETFGFYMVSLDIRENARDLQKVVGAALERPDWAECPANERLDVIQSALNTNESPSDKLTNDTKRTLAIFQSVSYCRRRYGKRSIGSFIVGNCHGIDDVMAALLLGSWGDLRDSNGHVRLDVTPLFETVAELSQGPDIIRQMLQDETYKKHLEGRANQQTVMIGNSEYSTKGSFMSSRWALHWTRNTLIDIFDEADINATIFHGRSGNSVLDTKAESVNYGRLHATENGEAVNARYGVRGIAARTMEKTFSMVALNTGISERKDPKELEFWSSVMSSAASESRRCYQNLVFETDQFHDYFRLATPVDVIERLRLGTSTSKQEAEELGPMPGGRQSVPWGFAWAQSRHLLPGWFGVGSGLTIALQNHDIATLRLMAKQWPFFGRLLTDAQTALAIADLDIARNYSMLAGGLHAKFYPIIREEYEKSVAMVLDIREQDGLLDSNRTLRRSIRLRNPYVDPMSLLQVELLRRWREQDRDNEELLDALLASVHGIARGLQAAG
jgi:phosphoenolpyruvate carboxylase